MVFAATLTAGPMAPLPTARPMAPLPRRLHGNPHRRPHGTHPTRNPRAGPMATLTAGPMAPSPLHRQLWDTPLRWPRGSPQMMIVDLWRCLCDVPFRSVTRWTEEANWRHAEPLRKDVICEYGVVFVLMDNLIIAQCSASAARMAGVCSNPHRRPHGTPPCRRTHSELVTPINIKLPWIANTFRLFDLF